MTIVNKPDFTLFASEAKTGEVDTFPNLLRGWGVTLEQTAGKPPMEWFNALQQRTDHWLMYLSQRGIPTWDSRLTYPLFAVVQHAGKFYVAKKESSAQPPDTSQNVWMSMAAALDLPAGSLTEKGMLQLSNAINSDSETMAATPKAVKELAAQTLAKDQNGADIPDPARFIKNLGLQAQLSGRVLRIKKITQSQTYHWPDDVAAIDVTLCGGGGGGGAGASSPAGHGSAGSGGGGGGWARSYYQRGSIPAAVKIDIGKGGQGGVADGQQPAGGSPSLFGDLIKAYGGANALNGPVFRKGSQPMLVGNGGGGDASGGNLFSSRGGSGTPALFLGISHESGAGGDSVFSFGAPPLTDARTVSGFAGIDGAGGGGAFVTENSAGANGGNGGGGVCLIVEYSE